MNNFVGRQEELKSLQALLNKNAASLVVIRGRRRIGKSRLASEFGKAFSQVYTFSGLPPEKGVTAESQKKEFKRRLNELRIPHFSGDDWGDLFTSVAQKCKKGRILVVLDEVSWMGKKSPEFLGKLKTVWDLHLKNNPKLVMIVSGSQSTWIEKNIINNTGFVGRLSLQMILSELSLAECNQFWLAQRSHVSAYEKFKILAVMGGVPRYLEEIHIKRSAGDNIIRLCFEPKGILFNEFDLIFSDLFSKRSAKYKTIIQHLASGKASLDDIAKILNRSKGGDLTAYLHDLCQTGFVTRDDSWDIGTMRASKQSKYRLSDNYTRFYLKYIEPNKNRIISRNFGALPNGWSSILGFQFENLVLSPNNRQLLYELLEIPQDEVVWANPYLQSQNKQHRGCQIDLMIQTKYNTLYLCEIKFKREPLDLTIIQELEEKRKRLKIPKGFSIRPVLFHVNGVQETVIEQDYFAKIIDCDQLLQRPID